MSEKEASKRPEAKKQELKPAQDSPTKDSSIKPLPDKRSQPIPQAMPPPPGQSDNYKPRQEPKPEVKKEVKASIERVVDNKEELPPPAPAKGLDNLLSGSTTVPPPQAEQQADIASIYRQNDQPKAETDNSIYARNTPGATDTDQRRIYQNNPAEQNNPMKDYANRPRDAQGQDTDVFGNQELTLSGRIKKMYSRA